MYATRNLAQLSRRQHSSRWYTRIQNVAVYKGRLPQPQVKRGRESSLRAPYVQARTPLYVQHRRVNKLCLHQEYSTRHVPLVRDVRSDGRLS